ncbi:aldolase/citrate lyase family protein [Gaopeijia maritima]|uniref:Aldolase/citrate lyase family protein n=1 Tax=Gaopeijia maritima TaxID=3119007 RepID=A0ABU9EAR1_9BACT
MPRSLRPFALVAGAFALTAWTTACTSDTAEAGAEASEGVATTSSMAGDRINPMIALHEAGQPVFGLYAPSPGGGPARGDQPPPPVKTPEERAQETLAYGSSDYVFDGSMERGVAEGLPVFTSFAQALQAQGATTSSNPLVVKMAKITGAEQATNEVAMQLDAGASTIMFVEVESAEEARMGLDAMRYESNGGTRPDRVGTAPAYWGLSDAEYREVADLWPLNPEGELLSWVIVESFEGLENVREIAAVPGIGVLWPGAGTLRGLFTTENADGERVFDEEGWEAAIQSVLDACMEFDVPCGFPANASDIERRMDQGFSVFVMGWGDGGFETIDVGRAKSGR